MKYSEFFCLIVLFYSVFNYSFSITDVQNGKRYYIDLYNDTPNKVYHVVSVKGDIFIGNDFKRKIKAGDKLSGNMKVVAKTKDVSMTVYNTKDNIGRRTLSPGKFNGYKYGTIESLINFINAYFIPSQKIPATRDGILNNKIAVFNHFRATTRKDTHFKPYLVLGTSKIYISPEAYPLDEGSCFFIRYLYHGEKINKKIPSQNNFITITRDNLYRIDGNPVSGQGIEKVMQVYYYDSRKNKSILISDFQPVFPDEKKLIREVSVLISALKAAGRSSEILDEALSFLYEFYGTPYRDNVKDWLKKNFRSEIQ
ncbi:MAG: hypothetical protein Q3M24_16355 [Candidatus Electrothrix aestuarii]|uniref:Uncharacterized protein n=1 Tax=Candidatus Electrothrix aestuarii TaxID=3062594 RepID=A0AAU8LSK1_9BACT|nr:hypothetical protein [Candidatus Electrothrix aestuarii]